MAAPAALEEDPFGVFGDDDDDETEREATRQQDAGSPDQVKQEVQYRDGSNGVLVFRSGTEQALLLYVQQQLSKQKESNFQKQRELLLQSVDDFCYTRHWMMHVGPDKGKYLEEFLLTSAERFLVHKKDQQQNSCFTIVEVGTYCGYSLTKMAHKLLTAWPDFNFHIFTVDINPNNVAVAKQMVKMAGLESYVTFCLLPLHEKKEEPNLLSATVVTEMQQYFSNDNNNKGQQKQTIDFLFLDHDKNIYFSDLLQMERTGLIRKHTAVAADNVLFFGLDGYRQHMQDLAAAGVVETRLETDTLEYVVQSERIGEDLIDGLELTYYLQDPPRHDE